MSFVKKMQELQNKIPTLEGLDTKLTNATNSINSAKNELDKKIQEINNVKTELNNKYTSIESRLPVTATIDRDGIVTLSKFETLNTDGNKVITANVLKTVLDNLVDYIPEASTEQLGLIKIAKAEDINTDSNSVIGVSTLDEIKQPVDISNFRQKGKTKQNLSYFVDIYDKTFKTVTIFGTISIGTGDGYTTRIELPIEVIKESVSVVVTPINSTAVVYPTVIESKYIDLQVQENTSATLQIIACVSSQPTIVGVETVTNEDSDEISITITTEEGQ